MADTPDVPSDAYDGSTDHRLSADSETDPALPAGDMPTLLGRNGGRGRTEDLRELDKRWRGRPSQRHLTTTETPNRRRCHESDRTQHPPAPAPAQVVNEGRP